MEGIPALEYDFLSKSFQFFLNDQKKRNKKKSPANILSYPLMRGGLLLLLQSSPSGSQLPDVNAGKKKRVS